MESFLALLASDPSSRQRDSIVRSTSSANRNYVIMLIHRKKKQANLVLLYPSRISVARVKLISSEQRSGNCRSKADSAGSHVDSALLLRRHQLYSLKADSACMIKRNQPAFFFRRINRSCA